jgi:hypothetical protein
MDAHLALLLGKRWVFGLGCVLIVVLLAACGQVAGAPTTSPVPSATGPATTSPSELLPLEYYSPLANAQYVSKDDTIILRYGPSLTAEQAGRLQVHIQGSQSGVHSGKQFLALDNRTVIFQPQQPFTPGEQVKVMVGSLSLPAGEIYQPLDYTFVVAANQQPGEVASTAIPTVTIQSAFPNSLTLPQDIPHYTVYTTTSTLANEGYIFIAPFYWTKSTLGSYLLILDNNGQIVYYQSVADQYAAFDFKVLPSGYMTCYDQKDAVHVVMNSQYQVVGKYTAQNGYMADLHDFLVTPEGYSFLMAYDTETMDMSQVISGGNPKAAVTGLIVQELDPAQNVIFEWRSWDHFAFTDSTSSLTTEQIDLIHGNGLALTNDGNLLLSSRNLSEITKINLQTGSILWRLGGKNSDFQFVNDAGFAYQHNINFLPDGNITLFDNHGTDQAPTASRAVEYKLDPAAKTATLVWEFSHTPPVFTDYMGDVQRLANGNTFIGWGNTGTMPDGFAIRSATEVTASNQVVFDMAFDYPYVSYRAFRSPWVGNPKTTPDLAFSQDAGSLTLGYSWNGATDVASWNIYGGNNLQDLRLVDQKTKVAFETQSYLVFLPSDECYFQAAALDKNGTELGRSVIITTEVTTCPLSQ